MTRRAAPSGGRSRRNARTEPITITAIATGGAGVGRLADGRVAFTQRTAPGDRAEVRITTARKRWVGAELVRLIEPGPGRREAPCPFYARCGGCTLEHMDYDAQLRAKASIVAETLRRIGGIDTGLPEIVASPAEFEYRNRVSFTLVRLGTGRVVAGFHELGRAGTVLDLDERCLLPEPVLREAWRDLRLEWGRDASRLPAGASLRLTLQSSTAGEVGLLVEDGFGDGRPDEILERVPAIRGIWKRDPEGDIRHLGGSARLDDHGAAGLEAGVFTQVNRAVARELDAYVIDRCGAVAGTTVVDAYSGTGGRARRLAVAGARVTSIELDARAVAEARRHRDVEVEIVEGRVEEHLAAALPADTVIVNPPRAGLDVSVCDTLLERPPARLMYVSCDPATLARDCGRLAPRLSPAGVRCFDMFPQTAHVETVLELQCATG